MTAALIPTPVMQFLDADGNPLVGGKVYTYAAGTSTPLATYTDYGGATPNANPVILNSRGEASIWFGTAAYKLELYTAATVLIWTADNVSASTPVVYGTGVAAALAINVGTAGSILVNGGALVGTTLSASGTSTMAAINASGLVSTGALTVTKAAAGDALTVTAAGSKTAFLYVDASYVYLATGAGGTKEYLAFDATNHLGYYALNGTSVWTATTSGLTIPGTLGVTGAAAFGGAVSTVAQTKLTGSWTGSGDAYGLEINHALTATSTNNILGVYVHQTVATASVNHVYIDGMAIDPPTISGTGTVTNANTLRIGGAPTISGGGTITNAKALWVTSGATQLDGTLATAGIVTMGAYGAGAATFSAAGVISSVSDERLKIKDGTIADPIPMMMALEPGYYFGKPEANMGDGRQLGFYAQNVRKAIGPEAAPDPEDQVNLDADGNEVSRTTRPWGYYDRSVLAVAIEALKVHEGRLAALQADFEAYKSSHP